MWFQKRNGVKQQPTAQAEQQDLPHDKGQQQMRSDDIITALSADYHTILQVDTKTDEVSCIRRHGTVDIGITEKDTISYREWSAGYAARVVTEDDRPAFIRFTDPESMLTGIQNGHAIIHRYRINRNGKDSFEQLKVVAVPSVGEDLHKFGLAFSDIDKESRDTIERINTLSTALADTEKAARPDGAFLSRMSHDIRTPMNAIIGLNTLALNDDTISARTRNYLEKIGESAQHLLGLINDILDISRIESGRMTLHKQEFALKSLIEQVNNTIKAKCSDKGLTYTCHYLSPFDDFYYGDDVKLKEVLTSILNNAVSMTEAPGSVSMSVSRTALFDDQTTLLFSIRDTGAGFDEEQLSGLFDPLAGDDNVHTTHAITGLGLAIAKSLVEMMDGIISVESEKGVGTEFSVTVTLKNVVQRAADDAELIDLHNIYVLVVDDNLNSARYTKTVLDKVGIKSDYCTSGVDALRMIEIQHGKHDPYHLVLMDCNMPEMDGLEATEKIKAKYGNAITVVILTAYNYDYIAEDAERVGVDSFLVKPLFPANVVDEFERIVRRNHITRTQERGKAELAGRRILLAEDIAINAEILMDILSMENIKADHAQNGRLAVEMFRNSSEGEYSAVLMDVRMPEMNGLEAAKAIRALDRADARQIPIIALTANAFDEDIKYSLQAGMNAHLCKPVQAEQLFQVMGELIQDE